VPYAAVLFEGCSVGLVLAGRRS